MVIGIYIVIILIPVILYSYILYLYNKNNGNDIKSKLSGFEVARKVLDNHNLNNYIVLVKGTLNSHYDYSHKVVRLTQETYDGTSFSSTIDALRVSMYAVLDNENDKLSHVRSLLLPFIEFITLLSYILFVIFVIFKDFNGVKIATLLLFIVLLFYLINLKFENKVMTEGKKELDKLKILTKKEIEDSENLFKVFPFIIVTSMITVVFKLFNNVKR